MPVITMASSKGGVGKTTSALLLALELASAGARIALVDGDRNQPLSKWAALDGKPKNVDVISDTDESTITETIETAAAKFTFVIVDLEGSANPMIMSAVSRSDLVIVPLQASIVDAHQATRTLELIRRYAHTSRQQVRSVLLLTKAPTIVSGEARAVQTELEAAGFHFLPAVIHERVAYRSLFSYGGDLSSLPSKGVGNLDTAKENARAFAQEVLGVLREPAVQAVA